MIRVGIVGCGPMAQYHFWGLNSIPGVKITACCDINFATRREFASRNNIPGVYKDYSELFAGEQLDAVSIVTPDGVHCEVTLAAIRKKLHVLCDKPLASNLADVKKMASAAKRAKIVNMVNFSYRACPAVVGAKKIIDGGQLGEITHVEASYLQSWLCGEDWKKHDSLLWRLNKKLGSNGALADIGIHMLDFTTLAVGEIKSVFCQTKTFQKCEQNKLRGCKLDANDSATINATFANGAIGTLNTTRLAAGQGNTRRLGVYGTKGSLRYDLEESEDKLQVSVGKDAAACKWQTIRCPKVNNIYQLFAQSIKTGKTIEPTFQRGLQMHKYIEKCLESAAAKTIVKI